MEKSDSATPSSQALMDVEFTRITDFLDRVTESEVVQEQGPKSGHMYLSYL